MGLLQNVEMLEKLKKYITNTNFGTQNLGHNITLSFLPIHLQNKLIDKRYSFTFKHRLVANKEFQKVTYSEVILELIEELNSEIKNVSEKTKELYTLTGMLINDRCTKDLIATVISNGIVINPASHKGNTTTKGKYTDNICNVYNEFGESNLIYFLNELDNYKIDE